MVRNSAEITHKATGGGGSISYIEQLKQVYTEFSQYLIQTGTEESNLENLNITRKYTAISESVDTCLNKLNPLLEKFAEHNVTPLHPLLSVRN